MSWIRFWILVFFFLEEELSLAHVFEVQRITSNCETCHDRFFCLLLLLFLVFLCDLLLVCVSVCVCVYVCMCVCVSFEAQGITYNCEICQDRFFVHYFSFFLVACVRERERDRER